ncbi:Sugar or nucleoside kinase, ribokinase family [Tropicimonas isoalkanivorans]|uniref:Sugar or nucleoside kinase, ribokinase family n=2 Tax=Tropicimonas isoalkanivorans TaxID=441112 RepID=A0A1I1LK11_9RHOB|nr:Sugar or nucleoside kinase, ribokinase family [Tropicimonas isoalkanivorans]
MTGPVVDLLYDVAAVPRSGEEAVVTGFAMAPGGGYNAMVAARRAGMAAICGGSIGTGPFSELVLAGMAAECIAVARPRDPGRDTGCCTVMIEPSGERTFVAAEGAEGHLTLADLLAMDLSGVSYVMVSGYTLLYRGAGAALVRWIETSPNLPPLLLDPCPLVAEIPTGILNPVLSRAAWISANAREATHLTGEADPEAAVAVLAEGREGAVLRAGAVGCWLATGGAVTHVEPYPVAPVDTNGAGDAHIGSFLARLDATGDALAAARYANIAAALSTTAKGPATAPEQNRVLSLLSSVETG